MNVNNEMIYQFNCSTGNFFSLNLGSANNGSKKYTGFNPGESVTPGGISSFSYGDSYLMVQKSTSEQCCNTLFVFIQWK